MMCVWRQIGFRRRWELPGESMQIEALPPQKVAVRYQTALAAGIEFLIALFVLVVYTVLHEGGHALVGLAFGGTITAFNTNFLNLTGHVGIEGNFSILQQCLVAVAGVSFPLLVWTAFVYFTPRQANLVLDSLKLIGSLAVLNTLLAWIVIPLLYLGGGRPGDDSTNFLNYSGAPPLLVTSVALLLYAGGWGFYVARLGGIAGARRLMAYYRAPRAVVDRQALRALRILVVTGVVVAGASVALNWYLTRTNPLGLPADYREVATLSLEATGYTDASVYQFTLDQPATAGFYILLQDIQAGPVEITLVGPNGYRNTFLKFGSAFNAVGRGTVHPQGLALEPGAYAIQLTVPRTPGRIMIATQLDGAEPGNR
jgi:hypothetical protein